MRPMRMGDSKTLSLGRDIRILALTIAAVTHGKGAY